MSNERGNLARLIRLHQRALELQGQHAATLFPERIGKMYRDATARLGVAVGDMELYARCLDNAPQPNAQARAAALVPKGTGKRSHKRKRAVDFVPDRKPPDLDYLGADRHNTGLPKGGDQ